MNKTFLITIGAVVIIFGGVFAYQYFGAQKDSVQNINQIVQSISEGCKIQPYNKSSLESGTIEADVRGGAICKFTI
ncbi:MAG: hypothetical protein WCG28_02430, partial [bacterium]